MFWGSPPLSQDCVTRRMKDVGRRIPLVFPKLFTHPSKEVSVVTQLVSQISFAIASGQLAPGEHLPSLRALAMQTGLHRNTIAKVYQQLADHGLIEIREGSGAYVRQSAAHDSSTATATIQTCLAALRQQGYHAPHIRQLFLGILEWQIQSMNHLHIVVPQADLGIAEVIHHELTTSLPELPPLHITPLEHLAALLPAPITLLTTPYFLPRVQQIAGPTTKILPLEVNPFREELQRIQSLPPHTCLGIVCRSPGVLQAVQGVLEGLRGQDLLVLTALATDTGAITTVAHRAQVIFTDATSHAPTAAIVKQVRGSLKPQIHLCPHYLHPQALDLLRQELRWTGAVEPPAAT